jgi:hypothetical protein
MLKGITNQHVFSHINLIAFSFILLIQGIVNHFLSFQVLEELEAAVHVFPDLLRTGHAGIKI